MPLGLSPKAPDPEQNTPIPNDSSIFTRLTSWMFPGKRAGVSHKLPNPWAPYDLADENMYAETFYNAPRVKYSKAESEQTSAKLWSIYITEAQRYDSALVESWKADMEGMLIFSGLFSASLTAFLIESYRTLQPDSGDRAVQVLAQISQQLTAMSNNASWTAPLTADFTPSPSSLVCNTLWFISLCLSLTCALLATLVEQWAREFLPINHVMMALIGGVLALFLMLYAILTLLPLVSLDCPYRTPFSVLLWNLNRDIRNRMNSAQPPLTSTINDAIVDLALQRPEARDRRAFAWTLDSLTDDYELAPFLEAIPEAIHGVHGFHLVNDYLFVPLLSNPSTQRSLGGRIGDIILSCTNMSPTDPMRSRGLAAALKALWALGMISGRTGDLFDHCGSIWFEKRTKDALPKSHVRTALELSAQAALNYSGMNNLRNHITSVVRGTERNGTPPEILVQEAKNILIMAKKTGTYSDALASHLDSLRGIADGSPSGTPTSDVVDILSAMIPEDVWLEVNVGVLLYFLMNTLRALHEGGDLSYEYVQTCLKIVPAVPLPEPGIQHMKRPFIFDSRDLDKIDPSQYTTVPGEILGIHWFMRGFLRILPLVNQDDAMPLVVRYLAKCKELWAVAFAIRECHLQYLMDSLVARLAPKPVADIDLVLEAICVMIILPQFEHYESEWADRDDKLWNYLVENDMLSGAEPSAIPTLMIIRKLIRLHTLALSALKEHHGNNHKCLEQMMVLAADPLLPGCLPTDILSEHYTPQEVHRNIKSRISQGVILALTTFLCGCVQPARPTRIHDTVQKICEWLPRSIEHADQPSIMALANSSLALATEVVKDANDFELNLTTGRLFKWLKRSLMPFCPPEAALIFQEATQMYLKFLETTPASSDWTEMKDMLLDLTDYLADCVKTVE